VSVADTLELSAREGRCKRVLPLAFKQVVRSTSTLDVLLTHYAAQGAQRPHLHEKTHVSFLIAGEVVERLEGRSYELLGPSIGIKPSGAVHDDMWGIRGALLLTIRTANEADALGGINLDPSWLPVRDSSLLQRLTRLILEEASEGLLDEVANDLVAVCGERVQADYKGTPPPWLLRAREEIWSAPSTPSVSRASYAAGVHRTHFSRMFSKHFGAPPSVFRQRARFARAVELLAHTADGLSDVAYAAGFYDQPHMSREFRAAMSITPASLRSLFADATSIQAERSLKL
jgi:AraC-like DNA-binding protein